MFPFEAILLVWPMFFVNKAVAASPTCPNWLALSILQTRGFCPAGSGYGCVRDPTMCTSDKPVCCTPEWCPTYGICSETSNFCRDINGQYASQGQLYQTDTSDPCSMCTCNQGLPENCQSLKCTEAPMCNNPLRIRGRCCEYQCPFNVDDEPIKGIRLIGGNSPRQGRVEVMINNTWGTVCDDNFNEKAARVICRMLGYDTPTYNAIVSKFGPGNDPVHFRDVTCFGNEQSLSWCMRGVRACTHSEDVGVSCLLAGQVPTASTEVIQTRPPITTAFTNSQCTKSSSIRLIGGRAEWMGRVEIYHNRQWGSVCDDYWGVNNAQVICRSLCYDPHDAAVFQDSLIPPGNGTIWLDDVRCNGDESVLERCQHASWGVHNCQHEEDVAVTCHPFENLLSTTLTVDADRWPIVRCRQDSVSACFDLSDVGNDARYVALTADAMGPTCSNAGRVNAFAFESSDLAPNSYSEFTNSTFKCLRIARNGCGTIMKKNQTHFIYTNNITRTNTAPSSGGSFRFIIQCAAQRYYSPLTASYKTFVPLVQIDKSYLYQVSMCFCNPADRPTDPCVPQNPVQVSQGSLLQACIILTTKEQNLEIVVHNCSVQGSLRVPEAQKLYLFKNKCRQEDSVVFSPWTALMYAFEFQARQYLNIQDEVFVVCQAYVCTVDDSSGLCDRTCTATEKPPQPTASTSVNDGSDLYGGANRRRHTRDVDGALQQGAGPDFVQVYLGPIRVSNFPNFLYNFDPEKFIRQSLAKNSTAVQRSRIQKSNIPEDSGSLVSVLQNEKGPVVAAPLSGTIKKLEGALQSGAHVRQFSPFITIFFVILILV